MPAIADTPVALAPLPPDVDLGDRRRLWIVEPDASWEVLDAVDETRRCRWGTRSTACRKPSVARFNRRRVRYSEPMDLDGVDSWWHYCGEHLYGRWVLGGRVVRWVLRPVAD